jgi:hypothetical protein
MNEANFLVQLAGTTLTSTDLVAFNPATGRVSGPPLPSFPDILAVADEKRAEMGIGMGLLQLQLPVSCPGLMSKSTLPPGLLCLEWQAS